MSTETRKDQYQGEISKLPKDIESIDWNSMGYPQVPELLRNLASNDQDTRIQASNKLEAEVILGGLNWQDFDLGKGISKVLRNEAQTLLVPFLINLLQPNSTNNKRDILYLLSTMLFYKDMLDEGEIYKERAIEIRTLIWDSRLIFVELLSSKEIATRTGALTILMDFNESTRINETYDLVVRRFEPRLVS